MSAVGGMKFMYVLYFFVVRTLDTMDYRCSAEIIQNHVLKKMSLGLTGHYGMYYGLWTMDITETHKTLDMSNIINFQDFVF